MPTTDILYIVLIVAIVILTVTIVWVANEAIGLIRSLRKSADDTAVVTREFKEKVLLASEALDRVGMAAATVLGMIEEAVSGIKDKRDKLADGIALVTGIGKYVKDRRKSPDKEVDAEEDEGEEIPGADIVTPPKKKIAKKEEKKVKESDSKEENSKMKAPPEENEPKQELPERDSSEKDLPKEEASKTDSAFSEKEQENKSEESEIKA